MMTNLNGTLLTCFALLGFSSSVLVACGGSDSDTGSGGVGGTSASGGMGATSGMGGSGGSGGAGGGWGDALPKDNSLDAIGQFLDSARYEGTGWTAETEAPRQQSSAVSPHQRVRVFLGQTLVSSQEAGNGEVGGTPHDAGSMAVKLLFDAADQVVGKAAMFKSAAGPEADAWTYFCYGPTGRCATDGTTPTREAPAYGQGRDASCFACHNGTIFTKLP